jgi:hypothetical protein
MNYGQDMDMNNLPRDGRGLVPPDVADLIRKTRVGEHWERYDSIVIGEGARALDPGWFDTWAQFAAAENLTWFSRRQPNVGASYQNQETERTDYAQDIHQTGIEWVCPVGMSDREELEVDGEVTPILFTQALPTMMGFRVILAEADEIAKAPANHFPSGYGNAGFFANGAAAPLVSGGTQGEPRVQNTWKWPEPLMLPAQGKLTCRGRVDNPLRQFLATLPGPGAKLIQDGAGNIVRLPNWYVIKVFHRGPRFLQLRGARSAAG